MRLTVSPTIFLAYDLYVMFEQEVVTAMDRSSQGVLDGHDTVACFSLRDGSEDILQRVSWEQLGFVGKQIDGGIFAIRPPRSLIGGIIDRWHAVDHTPPTGVPDRGF